jgi:pimeloyl-ACP methyl ester carboxylesterase
VSDLAERTVRVGGVRLHVRETGSGAPLLLVNGLGAHTAMWGPLERALPGMRLISFDAPGVGSSNVALPPPTMGMLADLVERLLDELGYEKVDALGYSFGGALTQELARRAPDRVRRIVLAATTPGWGGVPGSVRAMALACHPLRYFRRGYYERTIGQLAGGQARTDPEFVARHGAERLRKPPRLPGYYAQVAAITSWSSLGWLGEIGHPTLVVAGGDDPLIPPVNSVILARRLRRARLFLSPEEGHLLLMDDRSPALPAIGEFLSAATPSASATWRQAQRIDAAAESAALRAHGLGAFPWGPASAAWRLVNRAAA